MELFCKTMASRYSEVRLINEIHSRLYKLLRTHHFPMTQTAGVLALRDAFLGAGYDVELQEKERKINIEADVFVPSISEGFSFTSSISVDAAIKGSSDYPIGSINSLQDTVNIFFKNMERNIPHECGSRGKFRKYLDQSITTASKALDYCIQSQIDVQEDTVLVNRMLQDPGAYRSTVLAEVLSRHNLGIYENALERKEEGHRPSDNPDSINILLYNNWSTFNETNIPAPETFEKFFWRSYLYEVQRIKGYALESHFNLTQFMRAGEQILSPGTFMSWGKECELSQKLKD